MLILGIESSCDETAAAVLRDGHTLLSSVINSQVELHSLYGGVVPELASRKHLENIYPVVAAALAQAGVGLREIDGLAVTQGPGLIGSLLVGLSFAKALSAVHGIPHVGVDHIAGHLLSPFLEETKPEFPYVALIASGGHSSIFLIEDALTFVPLGRTRDDAAGEAFDKIGKLLGLPYPGGPAISRLAGEGNPQAVAFPRAWLEAESLDFSFSGLKTAVACHVHQLREKGETFSLADLCASFEAAVVEVLVEKAVRAAQGLGVTRLALAGGVAANPSLRAALLRRGKECGLRVFMPSPAFCTDNAAMIAVVGDHLLRAGRHDALDLNAVSRWPLN